MKARSLVPLLLTLLAGGALRAEPATIDADRYDSLHAAVDAVPAEGGVVRIPPGTYRVDRPLKVTTPDTTIRGAGPATHVKNINEDGEPALVLVHPDYNDSRETELPRVHVRNLRLTGNERSGAGIVAKRINFLLIHEATIRGHGGDGVRLDHCYENPRITDNQITSNKGAGLNLLGCHDSVVDGNTFEKNRDAVRCIDSFNLTMSGNKLDDHLRHGVVVENTYGSVISGNMIEECQDTAIILDRDCYGVTLSANVIAHELGGGIDVRDAHGCAITGNTFTIVKNHAVALRPDSGRITITGNNFSDSYVGGETKRKKSDREEDPNEAAGLFLDGTSDVTVSGNTFTGLRPGAIVHGERPSERVVVSDNVFTDTTVSTRHLQSGAAGDNIRPETSGEP